MVRLTLAAIGLTASALAVASVDSDTSELSSGAASTATRPAMSGDSLVEDQRAVERVIHDYVRAFNRQDASAIARLWAPNGVYENRATGEVVEGRRAIQEDYEELFQREPEIQVSVRLGRGRFIDTKTARLNGTATVNRPDDEPEEYSFSAIFVRQDGEWRLDSVEETSAPPPSTPREALRELAWMIGTWADESDDIRVETTTRWSRGGSFLIRSYSVQREGEDPREGTQVIGWDPRTRQIRSWLFEADGSFGEGFWTRSGADWLVRLNYVADDGSISTATQIITRLNPDRVRVQMVGQEVDGEPLPSTEPVLVARVSAEEPSFDQDER